MLRAAAAASSLFSCGLPHKRRHLLPLMISRLLRASAALSADCLLEKVTNAQCLRSICTPGHHSVSRSCYYMSCDMTLMERGLIIAIEIHHIQCVLSHSIRVEAFLLCMGMLLSQAVLSGSCRRQHSTACTL